MSAWIDQIFGSKIAMRGGVARRKITAIDKFASRSELKDECRARGYHIIQHGDQWLIFCDNAMVKLIL